MNFKPKQWKKKKNSKQRLSLLKTKRSCVNEYGIYALKAIEPGKLSLGTIEVIRRFIMNKTKRKSKLWSRISPDSHMTRKPAEVRMGRGKGAIDQWFARIKRGQIIFEINMNQSNLLKNLLNKIDHKIPFKSKIIKIK